MAMYPINLKTLRVPFIIVASLLFMLPFLAAADAPAPNDDRAQFETNFFEMMVPHHTSGIALGELCLQKAVHGDLREMCGKMVEDQKMERDMLRSWAEEWYDEDVQPYIPSNDQTELNRLSQLQGEEFEKQFMQTLKMHHEDAVTMADECTAKAYHGELKDMCDEMKQKQTEEIAMLEEWLCDWYGMCSGGGGDHPGDEKDQKSDEHSSDGSGDNHNLKDADKREWNQNENGWRNESNDWSDNHKSKDDNWSENDDSRKSQENDSRKWSSDSHNQRGNASGERGERRTSRW